MKLKCLFLLLLLGISFCVHAQKRPVILEKQLEIIRKEPDNGDALKFLCQYYLNKGDYSKTITYAEIMKNVADKTKNPLLQLYSYIYQAQAQMMSGREKIAKKNLNLSLELATKLNNDSTLVPSMVVSDSTLQILKPIITVPYDGFIKVSNWHNKIISNNNTLCF